MNELNDLGIQHIWYNSCMLTKESYLNWVEISRSAIFHNIKTFRKLVGSHVILAPTVKANAYGHGLIGFSKMALQAGADWLCVDALFEARELRKAGIKAPIYIMGYVMKKDLAEAVRLSCRLVVYSRETIAELARAAKKLKKKARVHIKVETGNYRQGIPAQEALALARYVCKFPQIELEGIATHFANIEDIGASDLVRSETEHLQSRDAPRKLKIGNFPAYQLENFLAAAAELKRYGIKIPMLHCANSAATLLFPETHLNMARVGISAYGFWPSENVKIAMHNLNPRVSLKPVLSWKTRIAQIKTVPRGAHIGYGCTYRAPHKIKLAVLPVGYYEGYDRGISDGGYVLIHGKRAPIRGRVCMNMTMVDITNIAEARAEDEAILIGKNGRKEITAEEMASWINTINYEIPTRINETLPRVVVK